jgi:predicted TIM-barrel fold metal-dependent hydrolase
MDDLASAYETFFSELSELRPAGAEVLDVHTHLGLDEDGRSLTPEQLVELLDEAGARRACVFPLHDPERHPAYRLPNDRVLRWAKESDGRFVPFCRLDPADDPLREAERCLANGARGIKLHPRAQTFGFADGAADGIFALAEEANVPMLIHAGRGMPPIAEGLSDLAHRHPGVRMILAHLGVADQGVLASRLADHPGTMFDTSWFSAFDMIGLMQRVPPERIVFGSDPPYGRTIGGLYMTLRSARASGYTDDDVRALIGGTSAGLIDRGELPEPTAPRGSGPIRIEPRLARLYQYGLMTWPAVMTGNTERALEMLDLAIAVCRDPDPGPAGPALERIAPALEAAKRLIPDPDQARAANGLLFLAFNLAGTEQLPD